MYLKLDDFRKKEEVLASSWESFLLASQEILVKFLKRLLVFFGEQIGGYFQELLIVVSPLSGSCAILKVKQQLKTIEP